MPKIRSHNLSDDERKILTEGYHTGRTFSFRRRCHIVLLKSQSFKSEDVAKIVGLHRNSVNKWLTRYEDGGIGGLETRPGQGRKPILDAKKDLEVIRNSVKEERQRLSHAKSNLEDLLGKEFCLKTLQRFLKNMGADTKEFG